MTADTETETETPDLSKLSKIRALLDKAESTATDFPAEAEALTAKAIELMERYRIDEAMIADAKPPQDRGKIIEKKFSIGAGPYVNTRMALATAIGDAHSVTVLTSNGLRGKMLYLIGYETDVELTEMLYTSLLVQATSALSSPEVQADKPTGVHGTKFARSFFMGFTDTIASRLRTSTSAAAADVPNVTGRSVALVLTDRRQSVEADVLRRYGQIRKARPVSPASSWDGRMAGVLAGNRADIRSDRRVSAGTQRALSA